MIAESESVGLAIEVDELVVSIRFRCADHYHAMRLGDSISEAVERDDGELSIGIRPSIGPMLAIAIRQAPKAAAAKSPGLGWLTLLIMLTGQGVGTIVGLSIGWNENLAGWLGAITSTAVMAALADFTMKTMQPVPFRRFLISGPFAPYMLSLMVGLWCGFHYAAAHP